MKVLIVDDEKESCDYLSDFVSKLNIPSGVINVTSSYNGGEALIKIKNINFDIIISDVNMPFCSGIELARLTREISPGTKMLLISGKNEIIESINSMDLGIEDFFTKPVNISKLAETIRKIDKLIFSENENSLPTDILSLNDDSVFKISDYAAPKNYETVSSSLKLVGIYSEKMFTLYNKLRKILEYQQIPVLITGETGTGKEIMAKFIHYENSRISGPFNAINCSNFSRELFEAELFGYEKGSFTGALTTGKKGMISESTNGSLFLDEITEISPDLQSKFLRVLQEREYYRIGGNKKEIVNTRFIFASNKNIKESVVRKEFREDLYYRINLCEIAIPPLRERKEEIIPLTFFFISNLCGEFKRQIKTIDVSVLKYLYNYSFPGNVRELKNLITKVIIFTENEHISLENLLSMMENQDLKYSHMVKSVKAHVDLLNFEIPDTPFDLEELNKHIIKKTLAKFDGNKSRTAKFLGLNRIQMYGRFKDDE